MSGFSHSNVLLDILSLSVSNCILLEIKLKEFEILRERLEMAQQMEDLVEKKYLSAKYVRQVILKQSDEDIERIAKEVEEEGGGEDEADIDAFA